MAAQYTPPAGNAANFAGVGATAYAPPAGNASNFAEAPLVVVHQIAASGGDYTSLVAWEAAQQRELPVVHEVAVASCGNFIDTTRVTVDGWTTDATRNIRIVAAQQHGGVYGTASYRLATNVGEGEACLTVNEPYTVIRGLCLRATPTTQASGWSYRGAVFSGEANVSGWVFERNIVVGDFSSWTLGNTNTAHGVTFQVDMLTDDYFINNLVYGFKHPVTSSQGRGFGSINHQNATKTYVYNNTIVDCGLCFADTYSDSVAKNNLANPAAGGVGYSAAFAPASSNNASSDATAPGTSARQSQTFTFVDAAGRDYHLAATDLGAKGFGANLSADPTYPFAVDFDGLTRTVPWDIGATIFVAGGGYTGQDVIGHIRILFRSP